MLKLASIVFAMTASACCLAQEPLPPTTATAPDAQATTPGLPPGATSECCRIIDGTPVSLEILDPLNSALLKRGDKFRIRLATPVSANGRTLLAAGIEGVGEVVHAEKSRSGGKAGELLLAARYLDHQGMQIRLRGLKAGGAGKDNTGAALATAVAVGMFALFVQGGEIDIPAGTLAQAKIAGDTTLPPMEQSPDSMAIATAMLPAEPDPAGMPAPDPSAPPQAIVPTPPAATAGAATAQHPSVETTQEPKE